jgi:hypothetical protein
MRYILKINVYTLDSIIKALHTVCGMAVVNTEVAQ